VAGAAGDDVVGDFIGGVPFADAIAADIGGGYLRRGQGGVPVLLVVGGANGFLLGIGAAAGFGALRGFCVENSLGDVEGAVEIRVGFAVDCVRAGAEDAPFAI
jgi:hypothetical protein